MKLQERFLKLFPHQTENYLDVDESILCENIADDFAIGFAEWKHYNSTFITRHPTKGLLFSVGLDNELYNLKQLLIKFKKETGL